MDQYIGEIRLFGFGFAPVGWALCNGQLLAIASNNALFSLLGTTYGGNGTTTFGLPDLRGRAPLGQGQGAGLSPRSMGEAGGGEAVRIQGAQLPGHTHTVAASSAATGKSPAGALPAYTGGASSYGTTADLAMSPTMVGGGGQGLPLGTMPPYLVLNWCIAVEGVYPSRS